MEMGLDTETEEIVILLNFCLFKVIEQGTNCARTVKIMIISSSKLKKNTETEKLILNCTFFLQ